MATAQTAALELKRRTRFFNGQLLDELDLKTEQEYHRTSLRLHSRMFRPGVVALDGRDDSLMVEEKGGSVAVRVKPGVAIDPLGRQLVNPSEVSVELAGSAGKAVLITIAYEEQDEQSADYGPRIEKTRTVEEPQIKVIPESDGLPSNQILLARVVVDAKGKIKQCADERQYARLYRSEASGWMRLPFLPTPFAGGEKKQDFTLFGTRAESPAQGADGCMAIPVPPGAAQIRQLKIGGESGKAVKLKLYCVSANGAETLALEREILILTGDSPPFEVSHRLGDDDALLLIVQAEGEARIHFVGVEFD
jgi:hypothetical protein